MIASVSAMVDIKTMIHSCYKNVPLNSPEEWLKAYRTMVVLDQVHLLEEYLDGQ